MMLLSAKLLTPDAAVVLIFLSNETGVVISLFFLSGKTGVESPGIFLSYKAGTLFFLV